MYEIRKKLQGTLGMAEKEYKPDYEKEAANQKRELDVIKRFKQSLLEFIDVVGPYSSRDGVALLLGTTEIDIIEREKTLAVIMKKIEEEKWKSEYGKANRDNI